MRSAFGTAIFLLCLISAPARSEERGDCADSTTTIAITACYGQLLGEAESAMTRKILQLKALKAFQGSQDLQDRLDTSQLAFLEYRKQVCDGIFAFWAGGTARNPETLACQLMLDRHRTQTLDNLYYVPLHD